MGKVRPAHIKKLAWKLIEAYPNKFGKDFKNNKILVDKYTNVGSTKIRNRVAGYITRLKKVSDINDKMELGASS